MMIHYYSVVLLTLFQFIYRLSLVNVISQLPPLCIIELIGELKLKMLHYNTLNIVDDNSNFKLHYNY